MSGLSTMPQRDRDEETTPPKAKKLKQNEISSSYSSSKESGKWSVIKPTKSLTSGVKDMDIEGRSLKRKYQRSASDSDDNEEDSIEINSIGCQTQDTVSRSSIKRPNTNTTEESSIESNSLVAASDKENEEDDIVIDEEDLRRRRERQLELFPSCVPLQYFSLDDHLRDERRKSKRLNRLLSAVRRGVEEEQAKKVSPEKPNLSVAVAVTSTPVTVSSLLPSGMENQLSGTPISSQPTVTSTATTVVNSIPSSIPSVVPISSNPLLTVTPIQSEEKKTNVLVSSASTVTGITSAASFTIPSSPSPSLNFQPPAPSVTPGMTASSVQTSQQMNSLQAIAGNLNFSQTTQPIVGGNSLFNIGVATKKPTSSLSTSRRRRK